jgi:hypothetical protein
VSRCACGAKLAPYAGRGRPRLRCEACAGDRSGLGTKWRAVNAGQAAAYNRARRAAYAANREVEQARGRLRYALKVRRRVAEARLDVERAMRRAGVGMTWHR